MSSHIRNNEKFGYWIKREEIEIHEGTYDTTHCSVSIAEIVDGVLPEDYTKLFARGSGYQDYDNFPCSQIELYSYRKQTDQEYFDSLCEYILPAEYQQNQYETYLWLKKVFEGDNNEIL